MDANRILLTLLVASGSLACGTSDSAALAARVDALEAQNAALSARVVALESGADAYAVGVGSVLSYEGGSLVLSGANLVVVNGSGVGGAPNGLGNLVIGYALSDGVSSRDPMTS